MKKQTNSQKNKNQHDQFLNEIDSPPSLNLQADSNSSNHTLQNQQYQENGVQNSLTIRNEEDESITKLMNDILPLNEKEKNLNHGKSKNTNIDQATLDFEGLNNLNSQFGPFSSQQEQQQQTAPPSFQSEKSNSSRNDNLKNSNPITSQTLLDEYLSASSSFFSHDEMHFEYLAPKPLNSPNTQISKKISVFHQFSWYVHDNMLFNLEIHPKTQLEHKQKLLQNQYFQKHIQSNQVKANQIRIQSLKESIGNSQLINNFKQIIKQSRNNQIEKIDFNDKRQFKYFPTVQSEKWNEADDISTIFVLNIYELPTLKQTHQIDLGLQQIKINDTRLRVYKDTICIYDDSCMLFFDFKIDQFQTSPINLRILTNHQTYIFHGYYSNDFIECIHIENKLIIRDKQDKSIKVRQIPNSVWDDIFDTIFYDFAFVICNREQNTFQVYDIQRDEFESKYKFCEMKKMDSCKDYRFNFTGLIVKDKNTRHLYTMNMKDLTSTDQLDSLLQDSYESSNSPDFKQIYSKLRYMHKTDQPHKILFVDNMNQYDMNNNHQAQFNQQQLYLCDLRSNNSFLYKFQFGIGKLIDANDALLHNNHYFCLYYDRNKEELSNIYIGLQIPLNSTNQTSLALDQEFPLDFHNHTRILFKNKSFEHQLKFQLNYHLQIQNLPYQLPIKESESILKVDKRFRNTQSFRWEVHQANYEKRHLYSRTGIRKVDKFGFAYILNQGNTSIYLEKQKIEFSNNEFKLTKVDQLRIDIPIKDSIIEQHIMSYDDSENIILRDMNNKFYLSSLKNTKLHEIPQISVIIDFDYQKLLYLTYDMLNIIKIRIHDGNIVKMKTINFKNQIMALFPYHQSYVDFYTKRQHFEVDYYSNMKIGKYIFVKIGENYILLKQKNLKLKGYVEFQNLGSLHKNGSIMQIENNQIVFYNCHDNDELTIIDSNILALLTKNNYFSFKLIIDLQAKTLSIIDHTCQQVCHLDFSHPYYFPKSLKHKLMSLPTNDKAVIRDLLNSQDRRHIFWFVGKMNTLEWLDSKTIQTIEAYSKKFIQYSENQQSKFPLFFFNKINNEPTVLDKAVNTNDIQRIQLYLNLMIKFNTSPLFNFAIDRNINKLLEMQFDMNEYLESKLAFVPILTENNFSSNSDTIITQEFNQSLNYVEIKQNYDEIMKNILIQEKDSNLRKNILVEAFLVNIPETLSSKKFIRNLTAMDQLEIFDTQIIKTIIDYKWQKYVKGFFRQKFVAFLVFLAALFIDIYYFVIEKDQRYLGQTIILKSVCWIYIAYTFYYQLKSFILQGYSAYFQDLFNINDLLLIATFNLTALLDLIDYTPEALAILYSILLIECFVSLNSYLRLFQGFSFLVSMIQAVFYDLRFFISFYTIVLVLYGMMFTLLQIQTQDDSDTNLYEGIDLTGYFIMAFRASIGDFQVDTFNQLNESHIIFAWIIWLSAVLFMNIILLNFIIAVISESYEKVMQKMEAQSYKMRAQLIKERELHLRKLRGIR
eukprot:403353324